MPSEKTVVAYVSGHGLGHAAREIEILRRIPFEIPLVIKTVSPEWFWREEMGRPFTFVRESFDVGCVQQDSIEIDIPATLAAWRTCDERNRSRFADEVDDLRHRQAGVVVTDVAAFPIEAAKAAGLPSIAVVNFTWADIYAGFRGEEPAFGPIAETMSSQYGGATLALDTDCSLPMPYFERREQVGLVARSGTPRRDLLAAHLPEAARGQRIGLVYLGNWGYPLPFAHLATFHDWHWIALVPPPVPVGNWTVIERHLMPHQDLVASADLVVSKPGYGIVGECLAAGTPLLYCPRPGFAEYPALDAALQAWSGGLRASLDAFLSAEWGDLLNRVPARGTTPRLPAEGGQRAAEIILRILNTS